MICRKTKVMAAIIVVMVALTGYWYFQAHLLHLKIALASEQINIFQQMARQSSNGDVAQAIRCLGYAANYYPAGTKHDSKTKLSEIVESSRNNCIDDIIKDLRRLTGKDFGNTPEAWLHAFRFKDVTKTGS